MASSSVIIEIEDPQPIPDKAIKLYEYHEIPYFLRGNAYITDGYRAYLNSKWCIKSLFMMSNESINIWSHILGFWYFSFLLIYDNFLKIPYVAGSTLADYLVFSALLIGFQLCMLFSAGYHVFCCHSERVFHRWFALDLAGISLGLCTCYIPSVYYAFYCHVTLRTLYLTGVCILTILTISFQAHPHFLTSHWARRRLLLFCSMVAYGVMPSTHWVYLNGGWDQEIVKLFIPRVVVQYILGILALSFYAFKIPERYFPGKLNYIGSSHQWWHLLVVIAFCWWHQSCIFYMEYLKEHECEATTVYTDNMPVL
ncbi:progestin and adipoQ receptor family member 3-like [Actinia tenebrosa]|uniref:Progestin and adipoQ receptor family member 3-like n=1 Tax=Actinia tenebrosa TaxID=6105 RepID=A0A6P8IYX3_ACTTE|nr:progestin and adipoQ receptor family member 3-like [Actinia tenebrosa]